MISHAEPSINVVEHVIGIECRSSEGSLDEDNKALPGQVWVKPRANSSSLAAGKLAPVKEKQQRTMSRTLPANDDQLTFKEMKQGSILVDKNVTEKTESKRVAKEAAQIINGFSSLKNQIEELKSLFIQLKKENGDTKKYNLPKSKLRKQGSAQVSQKIPEQLSLNSPAKKKSNTETQKSSAKGVAKRSVSNSKRSVSQMNTFRSSLFGRTNLNGSLEGGEKNSMYSSEKQIIHKPKADHDKFKNLYTGAAFGKLPETDRKSTKNTLRKSSSKNAGLMSSSVFGKHLDPASQYFDSILGSLAKPMAVKSSKRSAEVLSLVNINNLYATVAHDSGLKKKIRKKFATPNKSHDKDLTSAKKMLESAVKPRDSFEEFRHTYSTARVRPKKPLVRESLKKLGDKQAKYFQDTSTYYTRTERGAKSTRLATDRITSRDKSTVVFI